MGHSAEKVVRRLERARREGRWIEVELTGSWQDNAKYGRVLALTDRWVVVHTLIQGSYLDDVALFRLKDITSVRWHPASEFMSRAVSGLGVPVTTFLIEPTATLSGMLRMIADRAELVMLHQRVTPDWRHVEVGKIHRVGTRRLELHAINDDGTWAQASGLRRLKPIERVEFGGRYVTALERFGEPTPPYDDDSDIAHVKI